MAEIDPTVSEGELQGLTASMRRLLLAFGFVSWLAGAAGAFLARNDIAASSLIVAGVISLLLSAVGRWPDRIGFAGGEASWRIRKAEEALQEGLEDAPPAAARVLEAARRQLIRPGASGVTAYDADIEAALRRTFPEAHLYRETTRSRREADFQLLRPGHPPAAIETKFVGDGTDVFRGRTLDPLLGNRDPAYRLLVVTNVSGVEAAREKVTSALGPRGQVIAWRGRQDDAELKKALDSLGVGPHLPSHA